MRLNQNTTAANKKTIIKEKNVCYCLFIFCSVYSIIDCLSKLHTLLHPSKQRIIPFSLSPEDNVPS